MKWKNEQDRNMKWKNESLAVSLVLHPTS